MYINIMDLNKINKLPECNEYVLYYVLNEFSRYFDICIINDPGLEKNACDINPQGPVSQHIP